MSLGAPAEAAPTLTTATLTAALAEDPEASYLVVGENLQTRALAILQERDENDQPGPCFMAVKLAVREDGDPNAWELF